jgi:hypothetical protein
MTGPTGAIPTVGTWSWNVANMWKKDGVPIDWSRPRYSHAIVFWSAGGNISDYPIPGNPLWGDENPNDYFPMIIRFTAFIVSPGTTFSGWDRYAIDITSSPSVSVATSQKFGYKAKYLNFTNLSTTVNWLKKPAWVNLYPPDSVYGIALALQGKDSMKVVISAGNSSDTMVVVIHTADYLVLEAESGTLTAPMVKVTDSKASGGKCISAPGGTNTIAKNIESSYTIPNMLAGDYYVWLRIFLPTGNLTNNFGTLVGFGTSLNPTTNLKPLVENTYTWVRSQTSFTLPAGTNTFIMGHSLALARIDQIVFTTSGEPTLPAILPPPSAIKEIESYKTGLKGSKIIARPLSGGAINFVLSGKDIRDFELNIYSVSGSLVKSFKKFQTGSPGNSIIWDGANTQLKPVRSGVYLAKIQTDNGSMRTPVLLWR